MVGTLSLEGGQADVRITLGPFTHSPGKAVPCKAGPTCGFEAGIMRSVVGTLFGITFVLGAGTAAADQPHAWQLGLQEGATALKRQIEWFHDDLLMWIIGAICVFVLGLLAYVLFHFHSTRNPTPSNTTHHTLIEVVWTVVPVLILLVIAIPSFRLLFLEDRIPEAGLTVKVTAHQWYWEYTYPDNGDLSVISNIIEGADLKPGDLRLLEVDNRMVVPVNTTVRLQITSGDVIHSWLMPSFAVQRYAIPGRLNETWFRADREGVFYGQCNQICGIRHGYMPIAVEVVSQDRFKSWVEKQKTASLNDPSIAVAAAR